MKHEHTDRTGHFAALIGLLALLLGVLFGFLGVGVWWIESRFGANMAAGVLIAALALSTATGAALLTHRIMRRTQESASDMIASVADAMRAQAGVHREIARADAARVVADTRRELIDHQQVVKLADQRAKLLLEVEEEKLRLRGFDQTVQAPAAASLWAPDDGGAIRFVE
jgi:hypothetical protein